MPPTPPQEPSSKPPEKPRSPGVAFAVGSRDAFVFVLRLSATTGLAVLCAAAGFLAGIFTLGWAALLVAAVLCVVGATVWRRAMLPAAVLAAALALPAAAATLSTTRFQPSRGTLIVAPRNSDDLDRDHTYRRGVGPVLVDLRQFEPSDGNRPTRIAARADFGRVVVALPQDRCFDLRIRSRVTDRQLTGGDPDPVQDVARSTLTALGARSGETEVFFMAGQALTSEARLRERQMLVHYGRAPLNTMLFGAFAPTPGGVTTVTPPSGTPGAPRSSRWRPTIELNLAASAQIVVRDFPDDVGPLGLGTTAGGGDQALGQVSGTLWPADRRAPLSPGQLGWRGRIDIRSAANRRAWVRWEHRMIGWGAAQARRFAGPCAGDYELRERAVTFFTQPQVVRTGEQTLRFPGKDRALRSSIEQPAVTSLQRLVKVEVNGLGEVRAVGVGFGDAGGAA